MGMQKKVDLVMNLMYNLLLAILLSVIAEAINAGGVSWPNIGIDTLISYVLEMFIALCLPFTKWGFAAASKCSKPGSVKFRIICSGVTAFFFATVMSAAMSFISVYLMLHLPIAVWLAAWMKIWLLFIIIAWVCAFFILPIFVKLAMKLLGVPTEKPTGAQSEEN